MDKRTKLSWSAFFAIAAGVLAFVGLPGLRDDLRAWKGVIEAAQASDSAWPKFIVGAVVAALAALVPWVWPPIWRRLRRQELRGSDETGHLDRELLEAKQKIANLENQLASLPVGPPSVSFHHITGLDNSNAATVEFVVAGRAVDRINGDGTAIKSAVVQVTISDAGRYADCATATRITEGDVPVVPEGGNDDPSALTVTVDVTAQVNVNDGDFDVVFTASNLGAGDYTYCFELAAEDTAGYSSTSTASKAFTWH